MKKLITVKEAAEMLNITAAAVYDYLRAGKLQGVKLAGTTWRTTEEDVEAFIKKWRDATCK